MRDVLFVLGANSCGTSTLVSMLNAHPLAFTLYEVEFDKGAEDTYRNAELVAHIPEARALFNCGADLTGAVLRFADRLAARGYDFRHVGNKLLWVPDAVLAANAGARFLYCVRDVRTWAVKSMNQREFFPARYPGWRDDVTPALVDYVRHFIAAFRLERHFIFRLERLVADRVKMVNDVAAFLDLQGAAALMQEWWTWSRFPAGHPKGMSDWPRVHASATLPPVTLDTQVETADHPFWRDLMPVFLKYFDGAADTFGSAEIDSDLAALAAMGPRHRARLEDLYLRYHSGSLQAAGENPGGKVDIVAKDVLKFST